MSLSCAPFNQKCPPRPYLLLPFPDTSLHPPLSSLFLQKSFLPQDLCTGCLYFPTSPLKTIFRS